MYWCKAYENKESIPFRAFKGKHILGGVSYGNDKNGFSMTQFILDGVSYDAVCDPDDGYRSSLGGVYLSEEQCPKNLPNIRVEIKETGPDLKNGTDIDGIVFIIDDKRKPRKPILLIGTDHNDNWYPSCVMNYTPENLVEVQDESKKVKLIFENGDGWVCTDGETWTKKIPISQLKSKSIGVFKVKG